METVVLKDRSTPSSAHKGISLQDIIDYTVTKGLSIDDTAKILGCSARNIYNRLEPYKETLSNHGFYKSNRQEVFDIIEQELVFSFTPTEIKKASFRDRSVLFGILRDKAMESKGLQGNYFTVIVQQAHAPSTQTGQATVIQAQDVVSVASKPQSEACK